MSIIISTTVKHELILLETEGVVPLTKKLNVFQSLKTIGHDNIRIRKLTIKYNSRTGSLGSGLITARVRDNRVDGDITPNVLNEVEFPATKSANIIWESNVWLYKTDLNNKSEPPIVFELSVSECNMTAGHSIGQFIIGCEMCFSKTMDLIKYKAPTATIRDVNNHVASLSLGKSFRMLGDAVPTVERARDTTPQESQSKLTLDEIALARALKRRPGSTNY